jgi:hypothetical protein
VLDILEVVAVSIEFALQADFDSDSVPQGPDIRLISRSMGTLFTGNEAMIEAIDNYKKARSKDIFFFEG